MGKITVVVGGQAGSEGKGAVTARLARDHKYEAAVRVGGPNAGHTVIGEHGVAWPLRQIPVSAVADPASFLMIAAGSEVDLEVLVREADSLEEAGYEVRRRLLVDHEATVLCEHHADIEAATINTGTTGKGIGAARAGRCLRKIERIQDIADVVGDQGIMIGDTQGALQSMQEDGDILIEGTQGHVLGSHAGYYPWCTSGDCRAIDFLAAAGLAPQPTDTWVVLRTYPIRIAGESGPLPKETSWEAIGVKPEITTVTKKVRRVGEWNWEWPLASVRANSYPGYRPKLALTFADYWWPELAGEDRQWLALASAGCARFMEEVENRLQARIRMLGTGPSTQILLEEREVRV